MATRKNIVIGLASLASVLLICFSFGFAQARECPDREAMTCEGIAYDASILCDQERMKPTGISVADEPDEVDVLCEGIPYPEHVKAPCRKRSIRMITDNPGGEEMIAEGPRQ